MDLPNPLGEFLRQYRQARDLTAMDVATLCQVPVATVLGIEHGDRPEADMMRTLSEGLGIPLVDLHRVMQGEHVPLPTGPAPFVGEPHDEEFEESEERPMTILEAVRGLSPAQVEKVMDYVQLLKLAERGRRTAPSP